MGENLPERLSGSNCYFRNGDCLRVELNYNTGGLGPKKKSTFVGYLNNHEHLAVLSTLKAVLFVGTCKY